MSLLSVEEEYQKNSNLRREDITYLKECLSKQPHLPAIPDETLIAFLHCCDYRLEATKLTIDSHYTLKTNTPEIWNNRDPLLPELQRALKVVEFTKLPGRDAAGNIVLLGRMVDAEMPSFVHADSNKVYAMFHDLMLYRAGLVPGVVMVFDNKGFTFDLVARLNLSLLRKYINYLQEGFPGKIINFHLINCVPVTEKLLAMAKAFLKSELLCKLRIHDSGLKTFHEYVQKEILPQEYGGSGGSFDDMRKRTIEELIQHRDWFMQDDKLQVDESKRIDPDKYSSNEFGMSGSFRKLDID